MRTTAVGLLATLFCLAILPEARPPRLLAQEVAWPDSAWPTATPESQGIDSDGLATTLEFIASEGFPVHSLQIVRNGYLVLDAYFYPYAGTTRHDVASVTKSVTATLVGIAIDRGHIEGTDQRVRDFFPELDAARRATIGAVTLEQLLSMSSGLLCGYEPGEPELLAMIASERWVDYALSLPMHVEPGTEFAYCSGNNHLLSAILQRATGMPADEFARANLFEPLGITDTYWPRDPQGVTHGWGDLQLHPHDMARIGYLYLNDGVWNGAPVVSAEWVTSSVRPRIGLQSPEGAYALGWWVNTGMLAGIYEARGRGGQRITVWPDQELVLAITAGGVDLGLLVPYLVAALRPNRPLPDNPEAKARLQRALAAAATAPGPRPIEPLPPAATMLSGRTYAMAPNSLGLESLSLGFADAVAEAVLSMTLAGTASRPGGTFEMLLGLDGVYRISESGPSSLPVGLKGEWVSEGTFVLRYSEVAGMNNFTLRAVFDGDSLSLTVDDPTGYFGQTIAGRATAAD